VIRQPVDFTGSTVAYNASTHTITITLGTPLTGGRRGHLETVASSVVTLTNPAITGTTGLAITPMAFATGNVQQF